MQVIMILKRLSLWRRWKTWKIYNCTKIKFITSNKHSRPLQILMYSQSLILKTILLRKINNLLIWYHHLSQISKNWMANSIKHHKKLRKCRVLKDLWIRPWKVLAQLRCFLILQKHHLSILKKLYIIFVKRNFPIADRSKKEKKNKTFCKSYKIITKSLMKISRKKS